MKSYLHYGSLRASHQQFDLKWEHRYYLSWKFDLDSTHSRICFHNEQNNAFQPHECKFQEPMSQHQEQSRLLYQGQSLEAWKGPHPNAHNTKKHCLPSTSAHKVVTDEQYSQYIEICFEIILLNFLPFQLLHPHEPPLPKKVHIF